jgi:DNA-binding MarR family transcriptional regulator
MNMSKKQARKKQARKKPARPSSRTGAVMDESAYRNLALFRKALRTFLAFSEQTARKAGLTSQQHQAVLVIRGLGPEQGVTIGDLANHLLLKPQTAVGLVDRLVGSNLVVRIPDDEDRRRVLLKLTAKAERILKDLSADHLSEISRDAPKLIHLLQDLSME